MHFLRRNFVPLKPCLSIAEKLQGFFGAPDTLTILSKIIKQLSKTKIQEEDIKECECPSSSDLLRDTLCNALCSFVTVLSTGGSCQQNKTRVTYLPKALHVLLLLSSSNPLILSVTPSDLRGHPEHSGCLLRLQLQSTKPCLTRNNLLAGRACQSGKQQRACGCSQIGPVSTVRSSLS